MRLQNYLLTEDLTYEQYTYSLDHLFDEQVNETLLGVIPSIFNEIKTIVKEIAEDFSVSVVDIIEAFKNKDFFKVMKKIGLGSMVGAFKAFNRILGQPLQKAFEELHDTAFFKKIRENEEAMNEFLDKYPVLKKLSGVALAGLLLYMWFNMTFVGAFDYDMDISIVSDAFVGLYTIVNFLTSPDLVKYAILFITGSVLGISCAWLGQSIYNLSLAVIYSFAKKNKHKIEPIIKKKIPFVKGVV